MTSHPQQKTIKIGIISALHQEQAGLIDSLQAAQTEMHGMRNFTSGRLWGHEVVCVVSRVGKVAATATVASLIHHYQVSHVIFTGVAGGIGHEVNIGDIVVAESLLQYDLDARPLFPRYEVPLLGISHFASDKALTDSLLQASATFIACDFKNVIDETDRITLGLYTPTLHHGLIGSGDEFIGSRGRQDALRQDLPDLLAVEMEGAAVAQVCFEFGIPFAVIRTISDGANEHSAVDFVHFIDKVASNYAFHIIKRWCELAASQQSQ